jgi:hypothetical protein
MPSSVSSFTNTQFFRQPLNTGRHVTLLTFMKSPSMAQLRLDGVQEAVAVREDVRFEEVPGAAE